MQSYSHITIYNPKFYEHSHFCRLLQSPQPAAAAFCLMNRQPTLSL